MYFLRHIPSYISNSTIYVKENILSRLLSCRNKFCCSSRPIGLPTYKTGGLLIITLLFISDKSILNSTHLWELIKILLMIYIKMQLTCYIITTFVANSWEINYLNPRFGFMKYARSHTLRTLFKWFCKTLTRARALVYVSSSALVCLLSRKCLRSVILSL